MDLKTIKHISSLARINLTEKEEEKMKNELSSVLGYIDKLNQANTDNIEPLYQTTGLVNALRPDEAGSIFDGEKLISQAPDKQNNFVKVKPILTK